MTGYIPIFEGFVWQNIPSFEFSQVDSKTFTQKQCRKPLKVQKEICQTSSTTSVKMYLIHYLHSIYSKPKGDNLSANYYFQRLVYLCSTFSQATNKEDIYIKLDNCNKHCRNIGNLSISTFCGLKFGIRIHTYTNTHTCVCKCIYVTFRVKIER